MAPVYGQTNLVLSTFEIASSKKSKFFNTYILSKNSASSPDMLGNEISLNKNHLVSSQPEFESDNGNKIISLNYL